MKMDEVANSGNDEFYTPRYAVYPLLKYLKPNSFVWCPFDTNKSLIVRTLEDVGHRVHATHLESGHDFFKVECPECDYIVSNPPYSKKTEVFERLFQLGKPFAMLVGVVGLFESKKRFQMFRENQFEVMWMSNRIAYFKDYNDESPSLHPPFSSVWVTKKVLPKGNVFEEIYKKGVDI